MAWGASSPGIGNTTVDVSKPLPPAAIAREAFKRLAAAGLPPTPEHYQRFYEELAGGQGATVDIPPWLLTLLRQWGERYGSPWVEIHAAARHGRTDSVERALSTLIQSCHDAAQHGVSWGALLGRLLHEWERSQQGLTHLQKRAAMSALLHEENPQLPLRLALIVDEWSLLPERALGQASLSDLEQPAAAAVGADGLATPDRAELPCANWQTLWRQALQLGILPWFAQDSVQAQGEKCLKAAENASGDAPRPLLTAARELWRRIDEAGERQMELRQGLEHLLRLIVDNVTELLPEDKWLSGQMALLQGIISQPLDNERVQQAENSLKDIIYKQGVLKHSVEEARAAVKELVGLIIQGIGEFSDRSGSYYRNLETSLKHLEAIDDWESIHDIVSRIIGDSKEMQLRGRQLRDDLLQARQQVEMAQVQIHQLETELEQTSQLIHTDPLTGVLNRRGLDAAFERESNRAQRLRQPLSLAMLDLDYFKRINDTYGHDLGDEILRHLTQLLIRDLRPSDVVARFGGEEFIVLLPDADTPHALQAIARVQQGLARTPVRHKDAPIAVTFSAGVSLWQPGERLAAVIERADGALYRAKKAGRNLILLADS
jgi:diguanylate cyclase